MRIVVTAASGLDRFASRIAALPKEAGRAMVEGLNEGGDLERTKVRRDLKEQTGAIRYGAVLKRTGSRRATPGNLEYRVYGYDKGMPIREFPVSAAPGGAVRASPWGVARTFERSFMTTKRGLLLARRGASRFPIRGLFGPSVAKEIVQGDTAANFEATDPAGVMAPVMKRLGRLLP